MRSLDASLPPIVHATQKHVIEPVWRTIDECVGQSYTVAASPPSVKGSTESALKHLQEQRYGLPPTITSERRINRRELTDQEYRAQCVAVCGTIENIDRRTGISPIHLSAILARFAYPTPFDHPWNPRKITKRAFGVHGLADHFGSFCTTSNPSAIKALIWGNYMQTCKRRLGQALLEARSEWSNAAIEREYGVPKRTIQEDRMTLKRLIQNTEKQALLVLEYYFTRAGLIGEFE